MCKLVDEDVLGGLAPRRDGGLLIENSAAAVLAPRFTRISSTSYGADAASIAKRSVVVSQRVPLNAKDIELHGGCRPGNLKNSHVEVRSPRLERFEGKQRADQPAASARNFGELRRRVAFAHQQARSIFDLVGSILEYRTHATDGFGGVRLTAREPGSISVAHNSRNIFALVTFLDDDANGVVRPWEPHRFMERPIRRPNVRRGLPLAVDGSKAARIDGAVGCSLDDLEEILAEIGRVDRVVSSFPAMPRRSRPHRGLSLLLPARPCGNSPPASCGRSRSLVRAVRRARWARCVGCDDCRPSAGRKEHHRRNDEFLHLQIPRIIRSIDLQL